MKPGVHSRGRTSQRKRRGKPRIGEQAIQSGPAAGVRPGDEASAAQAQDVEHLWYHVTAYPPGRGSYDGWIYSANVGAIYDSTGAWC